MPDFETKDSWLWARPGQLVIVRVNEMRAEDAPAAPVPVPPDLPPLPDSGELPEPQKAPSATGTDDANSLDLECERGRALFDSGEYEQALECYQSIAAESPFEGTARFNVAICLERLKRFDEAEQALRDAIDLGGPSEARVALGWRLLGNQKTVEALAEFDHCLDEGPESMDAAFGRAVALDRLGRQSDALAAYSAIPDSHPRYQDALANIIAITGENSDRVKMRAASTELLRLRPGSISGLSGLIGAELAENQAADAAEHGWELVRLAPQSFEGWFNLGLARQMLNRLDDAAEAYSEAIKIAPDRIQARANMAVILERRSDVAGARRELERVLAINPENPGALWNLALICERDGHLESAERMYRDLIRLGHQTALASFRAGFLCLERGAAASAVQEFERSVKERPDWAAAWFNLALAWLRSGDRVEALNALQEAKTLEPDSEQVQRMSAVFAVEDGDFELASQLEARLSARGAQTAEITYNIGVLLQNSRRYEEAIRYFERAREQNPELVVPCSLAAAS